MAPLRPAPALAGVASYTVARTPTPTDLVLDGNEGAGPSPALLERLAGFDGELLRRYPNPRPLEARLAGRHGVDAARVVVTAGADEALDRICRSLLTPERELVLPVPTFVMIARYAHLSGGRVVEVAWPEGPFPRSSVADVIGPDTAIVCVVSPNNPTGAVASADDVRDLARRAPEVLFVVDNAYAEFAEEDLGGLATELENVCLLRTFSKAQGLAGLRVGYAVAPTELAGWMRAAGGPYAVSALSLALAEASLELDGEKSARYVARIRDERERLRALLASHGIDAPASQGNFVFPRFENEAWVQEALAGLGIAVRRFPGEPHLEGRLRITCPGNEPDFARLAHALSTALAPEALLLDPRALEPGVPLPVKVSDRLASATSEVCDLAAAMQRLGATRGWYVGADAANMPVARAAGLVPLSLDPEGPARGAARCLSSLAELEELLP